MTNIELHSVPKNTSNALLLKRASSSSSFETPEKFSMLGVQIDNCTLTDAIDKIVDSAQTKSRHAYAFVNADCLNQASRNSSYARVLSHQQKVFADGSGIRLAAKIRGINVRGNVNGTDLFPLLCAEMEKQGLSLFLLGAAPGIADAVVKNILEKFPNLKIAGTQDGFFKSADTPSVIEKINNTKADILLVAMGVPCQELWIESNFSHLNCQVAIGVGGLFDFFSGRISRAPVWMRQTGLEWIWRFLQEPRRMWRRYILGNPLFLFRCWREKQANANVDELGWSSPFANLRGKIKQMHWKFRRKSYGFYKRTLDVALASVGVAVLTPFFLLIALAIKFESPGPIFFSQTRVGQGGARFRMWKFRSMFIDAEVRRAALLAQSDRNGSHFKMKSDPRVTRIGRIIRRASIDELPQLLNVLKGQMSIVGPRPNLEGEVAKYKIDEFGRLDTKPGITCIWQVSGRAEIPWDRQVEMDLDYVYQPSIVSDIGLILRTLPAILSGKGAY